MFWLATTLLMTLLAWIFLQRKAGKSKRIKEGWNADQSLIKPLEKKGIPENITKSFLDLFEGKDFYPFLPEDRLHTGTRWEEQHIEVALLELSKTCNKKMPDSQKERENIILKIDTVEDFLMVLNGLPHSTE